MSRYLPAVTVWSADIGSNTNQDVHHVVMAATDGIVQGGDAFIVGLAGVAHLWKTFLISLSLLLLPLSWFQNDLLLTPNLLK